MPVGASGSSLDHVALATRSRSHFCGWDGPVCPAGRSYGPLLLSGRSSILVPIHLFSSRSEPRSLEIQSMAGRKQRGRGRGRGNRGRAFDRGRGSGRGGRGRGRGHWSQDNVARHETDPDFAFDDLNFRMSDPSDHPENSSS